MVVLKSREMVVLVGQDNRFFPVWEEEEEEEEDENKHQEDESRTTM